MERLLQEHRVHQEAVKTVSMFGIDLAGRKAEFEAKNGKGVEHEFQLLGKELEPIYGKRIWAVFHKPFGTEANVRRAAEICGKRGKAGDFAYFMGVLKRL